MNAQTTLPAIRRSVTVNVPVEKAFAVFTESFATWWPKHHVNPNGYEGAYIEPGVGGRWFERAPDGSECDWGRVLGWDPPHRVLLSWHLNGEYDYDPNTARASEVEVRFIAEGPTTTRVELVHSKLERAVGGARLGESVAGDTGWGWIMERYADLVDGRELAPLA